MTWVKLDDGFADHPKVEQVGHAAAWLHVSALCYCARHLTDGVVPKSFIRKTSVPSPARHAAALVASGMWYDEGSHYRIHDYLDYQPSKEQVLADRGIARRRSAMNADPELRKALRERDGDRCRYCGRKVNWRDRKSPLGGTYDHVLPLSKGGDEAIENLVVACRECNGRKGARSPADAGMVLIPSRSQPDSCLTDQGPRPDPSRPDPSPTDVAYVGTTSSPVTAPGTSLALDIIAARRPAVCSPAGFDDFWNVYPSKKAKGAARVAWSKAVKRAPVAVIVAGACRYAEDPNRDPDYTAHPATWLNADRWEDEPVARPVKVSKSSRAIAGWLEATS